MEFLKGVADFFIHLDEHLSMIVQYCGVWTYLILFLIIFCETGLVITPFLPGDSLLFAVGAFAASGTLSISIVFILLVIAAISGDTVNYWMGALVGPKVFHSKKSRFFRKEHLDRTHQFYEKYGGKTIIFARFIPIIRTFAPFVAGIGQMSYVRFLVYNVVGGLLWIVLFVLGGYFFGNLPIVKQNFSWVILAIIILSVLPAVFEFLRHRYRPIQQ